MTPKMFAIAPAENRSIQSENLAKIRKRQKTQPRLRLLRQVGKHHGHMVTSVAIAGTGDDHSVAVNFAAIVWRLEGHGHFCPRRKRSFAPEFNTVFRNNNRIGRQR